LKIIKFKKLIRQRKIKSPSGMSVEALSISLWAIRILLSYVLTPCVLANTEVSKVPEFIIEVEKLEAVREKTVR
jgi:hypothetical protein